MKKFKSGYKVVANTEWAWKLLNNYAYDGDVVRFFPTIKTKIPLPEEQLSESQLVEYFKRWMFMEFTSNISIIPEDVQKFIEWVKEEREAEKSEAKDSFH